jgi:uncharacterized protein
LSDVVPPRPDRPEQPSRQVVPWHPIESVPVFLIAALVGGVLGAPILTATGSRSIRYAALLVTGDIGLIATVLFWVRYVKRAPLASLGMPREPVRDVVTGLLGGGAIIVASAIAVAVEQAVARGVLGHELTSPSQVPTYVSGLVLVVLAPAVILVAPLGEELLFRGFLYRGLRSSLPVWASAIVSAVLFGLVHLAGGLALWPIVPPLMIVGIGLALVYERRQSLLASITAHALFNLVGFIAIVMSR